MFFDNHNTMILELTFRNTRICSELHFFNTTKICSLRIFSKHIKQKGEILHNTLIMLLGVGISFDGTVMMMDLYHDMQFSGIICLLLHLATHRQIKTTLLLFSQFSKPYFDILGLVWTECTYVSVCIYIYVGV